MIQWIRSDFDKLNSPIFSDFRSLSTLVFSDIWKFLQFFVAYLGDKSNHLTWNSSQFNFYYRDYYQFITLINKIFEPWLRMPWKRDSVCAIATTREKFQINWFEFCNFNSFARCNRRIEQPGIDINRQKTMALVLESVQMLTALDWFLYQLCVQRWWTQWLLESLKVPEWHCFVWIYCWSRMPRKWKITNTISRQNILSVAASDVWIVVRCFSDFDAELHRIYPCIYWMLGLLLRILWHNYK